MSVRTEADEQLDLADENLKEAIKSLTKIVVERCWGHDEYTKEYSAKIQESIRTLLQVRKKLGR